MIDDAQDPARPACGDVGVDAPPSLGPVASSAELSPDGRYRYALTRTWAPGRRVLWVMLNPSTADADTDDPTIRRVVGFSRAAGFGSADVANLFAYRATIPADLEAVGDPAAPQDGEAELVGPRADYWLDRLMTRCDAAVVAWGAPRFRSGSVVAAVIEKRAEQVLARLLEHVADVYRLGEPTLSGAPRHPLYLSAGVTWSPIRGASPIIPTPGSSPDGAQTCW